MRHRNRDRTPADVEELTRHTVGTRTAHEKAVRQLEKILDDCKHHERMEGDEPDIRTPRAWTTVSDRVQEVLDTLNASDQGKPKVVS